MLTGERPAVSDANEMKQKLAAALNSGKTEDLKAAMAAHDGWQFTDAERDDPELNANLARILAKLIAADATSGLLGDPREDLKAALTKAAANPTLKAQLKTEIASGQLATKKQGLDAEIAKIVA
jgi:hypothetical protein